MRKAYLSEEEIMQIGMYIVDTNCTVRKAAKIFNSRKSTIHYNMQVRLPKICTNLYAQVKSVLDNNAAERHMRGGQATRRKYKAG